MKALGRYSRMVWLLAIVITVLFGVLYSQRDAAFRILIRPDGEWRPPVSQVADAKQHAEWLIRPERPPPGAWETPWGVDVFFIHQTTAIWPDHSWNDTQISVGADVERAVDLYSGALNGAGATYAPAYRSAVLEAMLQPSDNARRALDVAYAGVLEAFDAYVEADNNRRAILVVGVEQGGLHAARLLQDRFSVGELRTRLAAAFLVDVAIAEDAVPLPVCERARDVGCVVAWRTAPAGRQTSEEIWPSIDAAGSYMPLTDTAAICVNPLSWERSGALAPKADHAGGVARLAEDGAPVIEPGVVSAQCIDGALQLLEVASGDLRRSRWWGWGERLKPADYNLFYGDLAANLAERARTISAQLDEIGPKPAKPLPPVSQLEDAPIHRPGPDL